MGQIARGKVEPRWDPGKLSHPEAYHHLNVRSRLVSKRKHDHLWSTSCGHPCWAFGISRHTAKADNVGFNLR